MKENKGKKLIAWLRYRLDQAFAGGTVIQVITLLIVIALIVASVGSLVGIFFKEGDVLTGMAVTLKHLSTMNALISDFGSESPVYFLIMVLVSLTGIGFYGTFIGIITSSIRERMKELSKGHSKIIEEGHVVVLGFSGNVHTILDELDKSNQNWTGNKNIIVADGNVSKEAMEDQFLLTPHLIFRSGNPSSESTLDTVSVEKARIVIINNDDDFDVVRIMLALVTYLKKCGAYMNEKMPVITVLMHDLECISSAKIAAGIHHDGDEEPGPYEDRIRILYIDNILAHIFAQACRQPGLSWVISEICDYSGSELYIEDTAASGRSLDEFFVGKTIRDINALLDQSIALGVQRGQDVILNPDPDTFRFEKGDKLIHLAGDDKEITIHKGDYDDCVGEPAVRHPKSGDGRLHFLILGWNGPIPIILHEIDAYCPSGSSVKILTSNPCASGSGENFDLSIECTDPYKWSNVLPFLEEYLPDSGDFADELTNIIIVGEENLDHTTADKKAVTMLLHIRDYLKEKNLKQQVTVTAEMHLPLHQYLLSQANSNDFIVGSEIASRILVQISNNPGLQPIFSGLLSDEGSEFYLRSFDDYVDTTKPFNFNFVEKVAFERSKSGKDKQEIAVGWMRTGDAKSNTIIRFNPTKADKSKLFKPVFEDDTFDNYKLIVVAVE